MHEPLVQQAAVAVLLDCCLPLLQNVAATRPELLVADSTHHSLAACLAKVLSTASLQPALVQRMGRAGGSAHLEQSIQVLESLALSTVTGKPSQRAAHKCTAGSLALSALCCMYCSSQPLAATRAAAAWRYLEALPQVAAMLVRVATDPAEPESDLALLCGSLSLSTDALLEQLPATSNDEQLLAWAKAAHAATRLVPALVQLRERCTDPPPSPRQQQQQQQHGVVKLAHSLFRALWGRGARHASQYASQSGPHAAQQQACEQLNRQLWLLHTSMCRLFHFLASTQAFWLLPGGTKDQVFVMQAHFTALHAFLQKRARSANSSGQLRCDCACCTTHCTFNLKQGSAPCRWVCSHPFFAVGSTA